MRCSVVIGLLAMVLATPALADDLFRRHGVDCREARWCSMNS